MDDGTNDSDRIVTSPVGFRTPMLVGHDKMYASFLDSAATI